ncbi:hypothetical protein L9F63_017003 [Diploptera punctata]|uniref:Secernin-2 n=1 Tax=Diploptera punctata TaxID=6984 RepID=A0AAD7ZZX9_DIPPU|nr:hypothetical protein L9F63_017003 [Diploptera punctata]
MQLISCDTFVVLPPLTGHGGIVFGKNSDRPSGEVQELIYESAKQYPAGEKLQCTFIEVEQVEATQAVILSKPAWMWGAEMGANESGVVIGNEAVWTRLSGPEDSDEKLLGMDLVRLGLERASTAEQAVEVISALLERYGQGGPCSDVIPDFTYHNSFLIADPREAWVLETAGTVWAAEKVTAGCRNISNALSIGTKIDRSSSDMKEVAQKNGLWDGEAEFNFAAVFGENRGNASDREVCGRNLLEKLSADNKFSVLSMFQVLRDEDSGICRSPDDSFPTTGSQVSLLGAVGSGKPDCHWFTATPNPRTSVFKPFIFTPSSRISHHTRSPVIEDDPAKVVPRFQRKVDRAHSLYKLHSGASESSPLLASGHGVELCQRSQQVPAGLCCWTESC